VAALDGLDLDPATSTRMPQVVARMVSAGMPFAARYAFTSPPQITGQA
jgi:hypothetical protein